MVDISRFGHLPKEITSTMGRLQHRFFYSSIDVH